MREKDTNSGLDTLDPVGVELFIRRKNYQMTETTEESQNLQLELHKRDLKVQALLEDVAKTRNENADFRVNLTMLVEENNFLRQQLQEQQGASVVQDEPLADDTVK